MRRRALLTGAAALLGSGSAGAVLLSESSRPVVAASFTASNVSSATHDGAVDAVTIAPAGTVSWDGLDAAPTGCAVAVSVRDADSEAAAWTEVTTETLPISGLSDSDDFEIRESGAGNSPHSGGSIDLTDGPFSAADFAASDGESATTTVDIRLVATITAEDTQRATVTDSFDVTVANRAADADTSGSANTGLEADSEVSGA